MTITAAPSTRPGAESIAAHVFTTPVVRELPPKPVADSNTW